MTMFTIDSDNNIAAHANPPASAENVQCFASDKELEKLAAGWPATRPVEVWNSFAGVTPFDDLKPVKKFTSRKTAIGRIWAAIQRLSAEGAQQARDVAPDRKRSGKVAAKRSRRVVARTGAKQSGNSKKGEVIAMMKRSKGATLAEIMAATGWQKHTVRGFVSILGGKGGLKVESSKNSAGERIYRVVK